MAEQIAMAREVDELAALARSTPSPSGRGAAIEDGEIAWRLAKLRADVTALRAMTLASVSRAKRSSVPGPEGSMIKIFLADRRQELARLSMDILGTDALTLHADGLPRAYLRSFAATIGGGTSEIQRNIVGERVLGLPKDR
jgi:alkylation response protein AidB-like acyl-CoA dehydrogenase